ncbi:MAG: hypothetical protein QOJ40_923 [Verrucomicrobiota bacterium]
MMKCWMKRERLAILSAMNHQLHDEISLELARRVAARFRASPDVLSVARANLARWSRLNADAPSLLRCYVEWREILERPVEDICSVLCAETEEGQRLRQNSPFAGVLSPAEVWEIKSRFRRHATTPA